MALEDDIATLSQAHLFDLLDKEALRLVGFAADHLSLKPGDVLFRKGEPSDGAYVVGEGAIALDAKDDGSPTAFVAGPGALIGQAALFTKVRRPATAIAREPSAVLRITPALMRRVLEEFPAAAATMQVILAQELDSLSQGLERVRRQLDAIDRGSS